MVFDLDKFKPINDRYGHAAVDAVLREFSALQCASAREADLVGRIGGDEFAIYLQERTHRDAVAVAQQTPSGLSNRKPWNSVETEPITASLRIATTRPGRDFGSLLAAADDQVYLAKRTEGEQRRRPFLALDHTDRRTIADRTDGVTSVPEPLQRRSPMDGLRPHLQRGPVCRSADREFATAVVRIFHGTARHSNRVHRDDLMAYLSPKRRSGKPVRLFLADRFHHQIDGAWWPYTATLADELAGLVAALESRLGRVTHVDLNWSPQHSPPNLNWQDWRTKAQHIVTVGGEQGVASLLIVPNTTNNTLAGMVLHRAAGLPVNPRPGEQAMLVTADEILRAARRQHVPHRSIGVLRRDENVQRG